MKFYSEVTKKIYDTEEALAAAEKEVAEAEAKKAELAKNKKADAQKVEKAFKENNEAKREFNNKVVAARKMYTEAVTNAKNAFDEAVADANKTREAAEKNYDNVLKEFIDKHPEGYHLTLKDNDNVVTLSSQTDSFLNTITKEYNDLLSFLFKDMWGV